MPFILSNHPLDNTFESWCLVFLSSFACIIGALVVFIDQWKENGFLTKGAFLSASMSFGSGVLIYSSIASLLPESIEKLNDQPYLSYLYFLLGAALTGLLTYLIHYFLPTAIHTCDMEDASSSSTSTSSSINDHNKLDEEEFNIKKQSSIKTPLLHHHDHHHHHDKQSYTILMDDKSSNNSNTLINVIKSSSLPLFNHHPNYTYHEDHYNHLNSTTRRTSSSSSSTTSTINANDHHHPSNDFYQMGIQTALALCIHKFPEGLIMFISNEASTELGVSIGLAICLHNLIEGAMIALPLYYATKSRTKAFLFAAILGGASQPIGALIGYLLIGSISQDDYLFGILFAIVSGMMLYISIQSMLPQAIKADDRYVTMFFFLGIVSVGFISLLHAD
ncbi:unnamed protein product [Cunninghamella blakesleeana]